jgi:predicted NUDIX family NTP pyrophosphohydrolase
VALGTVRQAGGKVVHAWAAEGEYDAGSLTGATFEVEWPPRSGRKAAFPEVDRAGWFELETARRKLNEAQRRFIDRLEEKIGG